MITNYSYYNDGRVKDARHAGTGNTDFDRSYSYDHLGRMTEGLSGREARGLPPDPNDPTPYRQTYQYDVFSNLTSRTSSMWNHEINPFNGVYVNDRNTSWTYDDAGNLKNDGAGRVTTWDVANRVTKWETVFDTISQKYDGDGRAVKRVETRSDPLFTSTIFYLRSSVMGGLPVAEINQAGKREVGYVYANGMEIARYRKPSSSQGFEVQWSHAEPMTGDRIEGGVSITTDPLGGLVPGSDPFVVPDVEYGDLLEGRTSHTSDSDPFSLGSGCALDGVPVDCNLVISMANNGAATIAPLKTVLTVTQNGDSRLVPWDPISQSFRVWVNEQVIEEDLGRIGSDGSVRLGVGTRTIPAHWLYVGLELPLLSVGFQQQDLKEIWRQHKEEEARAGRGNPQPRKSLPCDYESSFPVFVQIAKRLGGYYYESKPGDPDSIAMIGGVKMSQQQVANMFNLILPDPLHPGGTDVAALINDRWYHLTIGYGKNHWPALTIR